MEWTPIQSSLGLVLGRRSSCWSRTIHWAHSIRSIRSYSSLALETGTLCLHWAPSLSSMALKKIIEPFDWYVLCKQQFEQNVYTIFTKRDKQIVVKCVGTFWAYFSCVCLLCASTSAWHICMSNIIP